MLENIEIIASLTFNCTQDTNTPLESRVCLEERPHHVYQLRIRIPLGIDLVWGSAGFHGLSVENVARGSLSGVEVWRAECQRADEPDTSTIWSEAFFDESALRRCDMHTSFDSLTKPSLTTTGHAFIKQLEHYGSVPGVPRIPIGSS